MGIKCYRDLTVWQAGVDLVESVYHLVRKLPRSELFALSSQIKRAAISIPSNIAEGHARSSRKEFLHFLSISLGSLAELETQLFLAQRMQYITKDELASNLSKTEELGRMIRGLQKALKSTSP